MQLFKKRPMNKTEFCIWFSLYLYFLGPNKCNIKTPAIYEIKKVMYLECLYNLQSLLKDFSNNLEKGEKMIVFSITKW